MLADCITRNRGTITRRVRRTRSCQRWLFDSWWYVPCNFVRLFFFAFDNFNDFSAIQSLIKNILYTEYPIIYEINKGQKDYITVFSINFFRIAIFLCNIQIIYSMSRKENVKKLIVKSSSWKIILIVSVEYSNLIMYN